MCILLPITVLESVKEVKWPYKLFMINLHESYVAKLGFKLGTPGSAVRHATDCSIEPGIFPQKCQFY